MIYGTNKGQESMPLLKFFLFSTEIEYVTDLLHMVLICVFTVRKHQPECFKQESLVLYNADRFYTPLRKCVTWHRMCPVCRMPSIISNIHVEKQLFSRRSKKATGHR